MIISRLINIFAFLTRHCRLQENQPLSVHQIEARYDFSMVKLMREWCKPWSPSRHFSFQPEFRAAAKSIVQCSFRVGVPKEIAYHVIEFLPRQWWKEGSARCWCEDCTLENSMSYMRWKLSYGDDGVDFDGNHGPQICPQYRCPKCRIAVYKNKEHCKKDAAAHRKDCSKPPYWIPGEQEDALCQLVEKIEEGKISSEERARLMAEAFGGGDDDDSWESVKSGEEAKDEDQKSVTAIILKWFDEKTYQSQRFEPTGFTDMYTDDE